MEAAYLLLDIFHNDENYGGSRIYQTTPEVAVADRGRGEGKGAMPPPGPVKVSYKTDGHQRWLHRFHVSHPITRPLDPLLGGDANPN